MGENAEKFKLFFLDVGLAGYCQGVDWNEMSKIEEASFLAKGKIAEQFVFQHLYYRDQGIEEPFLHYWFNERRNSDAEIDFVISNGERMIPIEVKAGQASRMKSMQVFCENRPATLKLSPIRFDLKYREEYEDTNTKGTIKNLMNYPLYLAPLIFQKEPEAGKSGSSVD
jgi:predicted AAA+ superfamily ATPase